MIASAAIRMKPEQFHPAEFAPGQKHRVELEIGADIRMPALLARGATPGKTLVASAAVHGDEFEGVQAIFECFQELDPNECAEIFWRFRWPIHRPSGLAPVSAHSIMRTSRY